MATSGLRWGRIALGGFLAELVPIACWVALAVGGWLAERGRPVAHHA